MLGPLDTLLALNVDKEARKDALAIAVACGGDMPALLRRARAIDREFLARLGGLPLRLEIQYEEVEPIRRRRLERLAGAATRLLQPPWRGLRPAVRACYDEPEFRALLREHLQLYGAEVYALSRGVRTPALVAPLRRLLAERLRATMDSQAKRLANDVTRLLYG